MPKRHIAQTTGRGYCIAGVSSQSTLTYRRGCASVSIYPYHKCIQHRYHPTEILLLNMRDLSTTLSQMRFARAGTLALSRPRSSRSSSGHSKLCLSQSFPSLAGRASFESSKTFPTPTSPPNYILTLLLIPVSTLTTSPVPGEHLTYSVLSSGVCHPTHRPQPGTSPKPIAVSRYNLHNGLEQLSALRKTNSVSIPVLLLDCVLHQLFCSEGIGLISKWVDDHIFIRILLEYLTEYTEACRIWAKKIQPTGAQHDGGRISYRGETFPDGTIEEFDEDCHFPFADLTTHSDRSDEDH